MEKWKASACIRVRLLKHSISSRVTTSLVQLLAFPTIRVMYSSRRRQLILSHFDRWRGISMCCVPCGGTGATQKYRARPGSLRDNVWTIISFRNFPSELHDAFEKDELSFYFFPIRTLRRNDRGGCCDTETVKLTIFFVPCTWKVGKFQFSPPNKKASIRLTLFRREAGNPLFCFSLRPFFPVFLLRIFNLPSLQRSHATERDIP